MAMNDKKQQREQRTEGDLQEKVGAGQPCRQDRERVAAS